MTSIDISSTNAGAAWVRLPEADGFSHLEATTRDAMLIELRDVAAFHGVVRSEGRNGKRKWKRGRGGHTPTAAAEVRAAVLNGFMLELHDCAGANCR